MSLIDIAAIVGVLLTIGGHFLIAARFWGKIDQRVQSNEEDISSNDISTSGELKEVNTKLDGLSVTLNRIDVALFGYDGNNGMRSEIRILKSDVQELKTSLAGKQDAEH